MYELVIHFLPPKPKAIVLSAIGMTLVTVVLVLVPGSVAGAIYADETMIIDLLIVGIPLLIVGGGLLIGCTLAMRPHGWRCLSGVLLILLGAMTTLAFLFIPLHELTMTRWARPFPQEAALLAEVLECLCGPVVVGVGLALVLIQMKRGARPAHLHDHEPPPA